MFVLSPTRGQNQSDALSVGVSATWRLDANGPVRQLVCELQPPLAREFTFPDATRHQFMRELAQHQSMIIGIFPSKESNHMAAQVFGQAPRTAKASALAAGLVARVDTAPLRTSTP